MKKIMSIILLATVMIFTSCDDDEISNLVNLVLAFNGLEDLGSEEVYEGWIIVDGSPVSTGTFTNPAGGTFQVDEEQLDSATAFVLSIEPADDSDPAPSNIKILQGDFSGNQAALNTNNVIANFSSIAGKYILATPTSEDTTDEKSGVWWLDNSGSSPVAGLTLPDLSGVSDWTYEGWVIFSGGDGSPISTGTFDNPGIADDNAATSPYKGSNGNGPNYPGEDFVTGSANGITFPSDLSGGKVVISVEPVPDNSTAPFLLKPLVGSVDAAVVAHEVQTMGTVNSLTGTATRN